MGDRAIEGERIFGRPFRYGKARRLIAVRRHGVGIGRKPERLRLPHRIGVNGPGACERDHGAFRNVFRRFAVQRNAFKREGHFHFVLDNGLFQRRHVAVGQPIICAVRVIFDIAGFVRGNGRLFGNVVNLLCRDGRELPFHAAAVEDDLRRGVGRGTGDRTDLDPRIFGVLHEQRHVCAFADDAHVHAVLATHEFVDPISVCVELMLVAVPDAVVRHVKDIRFGAGQEEQESFIPLRHLNGDALRRPFIRRPARCGIRNVPDIEFKDDRRTCFELVGNIQRHGIRPLIARIIGYGAFNGDDLRQREFDLAAAGGDVDRLRAVAFRRDGIVARDHFGERVAADRVGINRRAAREGDHGAACNGFRGFAVQRDAVYRKRDIDGHIELNAIFRRLLAVFKPIICAVRIVGIVAGLCGRCRYFGNIFQLCNADTRPCIGRLHAVEYDLGSRIGRGTYPAHFVPCARLFGKQDKRIGKAENAELQPAVRPKCVRYIAVAGLVVIYIGIFRHGVRKVVRRELTDARF